MFTLTAVNTPAELGSAATPADMAAWNALVADHPRAGEEITEAEWLALLDRIAEPKSSIINPVGAVVYHKSEAGMPSAHNGGPWFFEPEGYDGDVFSPGYATKAEAEASAAAWAAANEADEEVDG